jgi:thiol-disulfide isomerase/thioredoxin
MARRPEFFSGNTLYPIIAALVALSALFGLVVLPRLSPPGGDMLRKPAPDFSLPIVANGDPGSRLKLSELQGKIVLLDFWATWCGPCAVQAPILDRIARKYPDDLMVLGVNVGESPARARAYAKQKGLSYPILADPHQQVQALYGASTLPTVVLIDQKGHITAFVRGVVSQNRLERAIVGLL